MTIATLPSSPGFTDTRFGLISNTQTDLTSPIVQTSQILELPGARWRARYALPSMTRAQAAVWCAFLVAQRGRAGQFYGFDPDARTARGTAAAKAAGALTVLASSPEQSGASLELAGAEPFEAGVFEPGDYLAIDVGLGRQLFMATAATAAADSSGIFTVAIEPPIRTPPAGGEAAIVTDASCVMRLVEDEVGWDASKISRFGIEFEAVEVFVSGA